MMHIPTGLINRPFLDKSLLLPPIPIRQFLICILYASTVKKITSMLELKYAKLCKSYKILVPWMFL